MKLRRTADGLIAQHPSGTWVRLEGEGLSAEQSRDMIAFLAGGEETRAAAEAIVAGHSDEQAAAIAVDPGDAGIPFQPRSMRAFMLWESHVIDSSRMLVKRFFPPPAAKVVEGFERVTGKTFPKLKPNKRFYEKPTFYVANHGALLADGDPMWWPKHTEWLDFELELAFVLARPLADATPEEAGEAVGGWFVLNDWSARDVQADDARENIFGPVVKSKTFANSIGADVLTADELPDWTRMSGRVRVDGELWCEGSTAGPAARCRRDARLRLRRRAARAGRRDLDRDDARLLRPRARSLDPARPDGRAGDRRDRHAGEPDRR